MHKYSFDPCQSISNNSVYFYLYELHINYHINKSLFVLFSFDSILSDGEFTFSWGIFSFGDFSFLFLGLFSGKRLKMLSELSFELVDNDSSRGRFNSIFLFLELVKVQMLQFLFELSFEFVYNDSSRGLFDGRRFYILGIVFEYAIFIIFQGKFVVNILFVGAFRCIKLNFFVFTLRF